jgi:hypothetical protein
MIAYMRRLAFYQENLIPDQLSYLGAFRILEEDGLKGLLDVIRREVRARKAQFLVLDGLMTVHEKASSDLELKKFIHELQTQAVFSGCTMFLLTSAFEASQNFPPEHTMVDGLIAAARTPCRTSVAGSQAARWRLSGRGTFLPHHGPWAGGFSPYRDRTSGTDGTRSRRRREAFLPAAPCWTGARGRF